MILPLLGSPILRAGCNGPQGAEASDRWRRRPDFRILPASSSAGHSSGEEDVPKLDSLVIVARQGGATIARECHGQGEGIRMRGKVADEGPRIDIPESQQSVALAGQSEATIRRTGN